MGVAGQALILMLVTVIGICHQSMHVETQIELDNLSTRMVSGILDVAQGLRNLSLDLETELNQTKLDVNETVLRFEQRVTDNVNKSMSQAVREIMEQMMSSHRETLLEVKHLQSALGYLGSVYNRTHDEVDLCGDQKMSELVNRTEYLANQNIKLERLIEETNSTLSAQISSSERLIVNLLDTLEKKLTSPAKQQAVDESDCPAHWTRLLNSCYRLIKEPVKWKIAKFACKEMASHLVEIYSKDELRFIKSLLQKQNATVPVWTGAAKGDRGIWTWISTKLQINFIQIGLHTPTNDTVREYCGMLLPGYVKLESVTCWQEHFFVCRKWHPNGDAFN